MDTPPSMLKLSTSEQRLVAFAQGEFGGRLTEFLLTGLGHDALTQRGHLTITYADDEGQLQTRNVQIITYEPSDGPSLLPRYRAPLVLLALLQLMLYRGHVSEMGLRFDLKDVLNLLGWKDTHETRAEIDEALDRYSLLMYRWEMNKDELPSSNLSVYKAIESLISKYTIINRGAGAQQTEVREFNRVVFNTNFIQQMRQRSLFSIDWNKVQSVSRR